MEIVSIFKGRRLYFLNSAKIDYTASILSLYGYGFV